MKGGRLVPRLVRGMASGPKGKVLLPDGRWVRPEDIPQQPPDLPGTAKDAATQYGAAQGSKAISYTWGLFGAILVAVGVAGWRMRRAREADG